MRNKEKIVYLPVSDTMWRSFVKLNEDDEQQAYQTIANIVIDAILTSGQVPLEKWGPIVQNMLQLLALSNEKARQEA